jgi:CheY-like chemotaxis protein
MKTILIVEDMEDDVFFLQRALSASGITSPQQVVNDGRSALQYLGGEGPYADRLQYPLPFLVFLDLKLPYVMGLDVLTWIRQQRSCDSVFVAVLTSSQHDRDKEDAFRLGANDFLTKPATASKLIAMMDKLKTG